jgi:FtsP/CotA-like multicopper oxidase with cupredoxin domain
MLSTTTFHTNHTIGQAGTFWYHSHVSTQYCDGLRGPLVVYDPQDPHADLYDIDDGQHFCLLLSRSYGVHFLEIQNPQSLLLQTGDH